MLINLFIKRWTLETYSPKFLNMLENILDEKLYGTSYDLQSISYIRRNWYFKINIRKKMDLLSLKLRKMKQEYG